MTAIPNATADPTPPPPGTPPVFPPDAFVGRADLLRRAGAALAADSGHTGVLLHGPVGVGKTRLALELARASGYSAGVWFTIPDRAGRAPSALSDLIEVLRQRVSGVPPLDRADEGALADYLPTLRPVFAERPVLLVLDSAEPLLAEDGTWRGAWGAFFDAVTGHGGASRVIVTTRLRPARVDDRMLVEAVAPLPPDEATHLARQLPELATLGDGAADADLPRRILAAAAGNPLLLRLADGHATSREQLARLLPPPGALAAPPHAPMAAPGQVTGQPIGQPTGQPTGQPGEPTADGAQRLERWTGAALDSLTESARLLLHVLACLEDDDRTTHVIDEVWGACGGTGPWTRLLNELAARRLLILDAPAAAPTGAAAASGSAATRVLLERGVAETVRALTSTTVRTTVDEVLADFWRHRFAAVAKGAPAAETGGRLLALARAALPYLLRGRRPVFAARMLAEVLSWEARPVTAGRVAQLLRVCADAARGTDAERDVADTIGRALLKHAPEEAERRLDALLSEAVAAGDDTRAGEINQLLVAHYVATGRPNDAMSRVGRQGQLMGLALGEAMGTAAKATEVGAAGMSLAAGPPGVLPEYRVPTVDAPNPGPVDPPVPSPPVPPGPLGPPAPGTSVGAVGAGAFPDFAAGGPGVSPWFDVLERLQALGSDNLMGDHGTVLAEVHRLLGELPKMPAPQHFEGNIVPMVHENLLRLGIAAAGALGRYDECLEFSSRVLEVLHDRDAEVVEVTQNRVSSHAWLVQLGRVEEAERELRECCEIFARYRAWRDLSGALAMLGTLYQSREAYRDAVSVNREALRCQYLVAEASPADLSGAHGTLAIALSRAGDAAAALAHLLAAMLLDALAGTGFNQALNEAEAERALGALPAVHPVPATLEALFAEVNHVPGVRLEAVLSGIATQEEAQRTLERVVAGLR